MGFRFRRTIKVLPGIRLNVSKSGISTSVGGRGATVNIGHGKVKTTVGMPGTGISYTKTYKLGHNSQRKDNPVFDSERCIFVNNNGFEYDPLGVKPNAKAFGMLSDSHLVGWISSSEYEQIQKSLQKMDTEEERRKYLQPIIQESADLLNAESQGNPGNSIVAVVVAGLVIILLILFLKLVGLGNL